MGRCKEVVLADLLQNKGYIRGPFGSALKRPEMKTEGVPVYEQQHAIYNNREFRFFIDDQKFHELKRFQVQTDDLIISCSGTVGKVSIIRDSDPKGIISQALLILRLDKDKVIPEYLKYFLCSREGYNAIVSRSSGSVQVNISKRNVIEQIPISLPSISEQGKIVDILKTIDDKILANEKINRNLSEQVASIYKSWFVDFDNNSGVKPTKWRAATLGDIAEIGSGKRPPMKQSDKSINVNIPIVGASSIMGYTNAALYTSKILVTGRVGTHGIIQRFNECCWPSDNTLVITSNRYEFVAQILASIDYTSMNRGSTQPLITQSDIKKTEIILPTEDALDAFENLAGNLMKQVEKNNVENKILAELRDVLLPKLMSGELDVSNLDI